jgi:prolyl-tRNA synthetase
MVTGANEDDWHLRGVDVARDIEVDRWLDVRRVAQGEGCPSCGEALEVRKCIEVGHIFKLGTKYSDALGARVLDEGGEERVIEMGSYGIGVGRAMAAIVEAHHDDRGIVWPVPVAPYEAVVTVLKPDDPETAAVGEHLYRSLLDGGIDVLVDDRGERPGVKFADAELIGVPYRITVGPRGLADGLVEVQRRRDGTTESLGPDESIDFVRAAVTAERR